MALNTCCMMSCSLLLACTYKIYNALRSENLEAEFLWQCRAFAQQCALACYCLGCVENAWSVLECDVSCAT